MLTRFCLLLFALAYSGGSSMDPVSLRQVLAATGGEAVGFADRGVGFDHVGIDSRTVRPGELFWALKGEQHDGHDYLQQAYQQGASAAVVEAGRTRDQFGPAITVPDTLAALWDFSRWYRQSQDALVIGVTGSFGKTTTRAMIHSVLETRHAGTQSPKNYNNHFGVPLSLLEINAGHEFAVLEMGASAPGEIRDLAELTAPEIGVVTGIGAAHLSGFGSAEQIARAKGELAEALPETGILVLPGDDPVVRLLAERAACPVILVGEGPENRIRATDVVTGRNRLSFSVEGRRCELPVVGRHHLPAALCAVAIAREIGLRPDEIADGLRRFVPVSGRCRMEETGPWTVIDDSYNSNPESMAAACRALAEWPVSGRRLVVAGDMLELGERSEQLHYETGRLIGGLNIDGLIVHGRDASALLRGAAEAGMDGYRLAECATIETVLAVLECWLEPGDAVLVKGSRGMRMERVVQWLGEQVNSKEVNGHSALRACA